MTAQFHVLKTFNSGLDRLSARDKLFLRQKFHDPILWAFMDAQVLEARVQMDELDPSNVLPEDAASYLQAARDARMVWQFWTDLANYVRDWSSKPSV